MNSDMVVMIIGMAVVTYFTRFASFVLLRRSGVPDWLERWLKHMPTGILTALVIPGILAPRGFIDFTISNDYLVAGILAAAAAYFSRNIVITMALGIGMILGLRTMGG